MQRVWVLEEESKFEYIGHFAVHGEQMFCIPGKEKSLQFSK